jgi:hypothetical protein
MSASSVKEHVYLNGVLRTTKESESPIPEGIGSPTHEDRNHARDSRQLRNCPVNRLPGQHWCVRCVSVHQSRHTLRGHSQHAQLS